MSKREDQENESTTPLHPNDADAVIIDEQQLHGLLFEAVALVPAFVLMQMGLLPLIRPVARALDRALPPWAGGPDHFAAGLTFMACLALLLVYLFPIRGFHPSDFGLTTRRAHVHIFFGAVYSIAAFFAGLFITVFIMVLAIVILGKFGISQSQIQDFFSRSISKETRNTELAHSAIGMITILFTAPVLEELIFRGVLFGALRRVTSFGVTAVITAGLFTALHFYIVGAPLIFVMALAAAYARERFQSLVPCIALHFVWNLKVFLVFVLPYFFHS